MILSKTFILRIFTSLLFSTIMTGCASLTEDGEVNDPAEAVNRSIYQFNQGFDNYVLKPVTLYYRKLPGPVQTGTHNFFMNLNDVIVISNDVFQLDVELATSDTLRFSVNTVFGVFGLVDMATPMGLPKHRKSFADTLGYWGVPSGSYVVIPFLGPSSVRDAPALVVDFFLHPASLITPTSAVVGLASVRMLDARSQLITVTDTRDELAFDPYIFTRESYYQWRQNRIYNGNPPQVIIEDFEDDFEDFEE